MIKDYHVRIDSACGIGQYKLWRKILDHDLSCYDRIIIVHTSPYRLHIQQNPLYAGNTTHNQADLLYQDIKNKPKSEFTELVCAWFEKVVDLDHLTHVHGLIVGEIQRLCVHRPTLHMTFFDYQLPDLVSINRIWQRYPGDINHLDQMGNAETFAFINSFLHQTG